MRAVEAGTADEPRFPAIRERRRRAAQADRMTKTPDAVASGVFG
ncbi:hypothetical protein FHS07_000639 [Microbacterium proteolyticum]|uniref:Uncharacterized protein n=1 Tax=Microbacterium proteolyticum TaxID=1572644 RepID=A0A7W5GEI9_9MICO|nr:hypothetical protein [Microbacterium proteolyticum]MBB3156955.1 hypothetical protein [Microbacterium proteolyticum]